MTVICRDQVDRAFASAGWPLRVAPETSELVCRSQVASILNGPVVSDEEARHRIRASAHWLPLIVDGMLDRIVWAAFDLPLDSSPFFYDVALARLPSMDASRFFASRCSVLSEGTLLPDENPPAGFIYHLSRCGSTLLGNALAAWPLAQVLFEGQPGSLGGLSWLTRNWSLVDSDQDPDTTSLRNLCAVSSRRLAPNLGPVFIKMTSFNLVFYSRFQSAFPNTPAIFLYRDPVEVFVSTLKRPPECWPKLGTAGGACISNPLAGPGSSMGQATFYRTVFTKLLQLAADQPSLKVLNYRDLNPANLGPILEQGFGLKPTRTHLAAMQAPFSFYSKHQHGQTPYSGDLSEKRSALPKWATDWLRETLWAPYQRLEARTDFPDLTPD